MPQKMLDSQRQYLNDPFVENTGLNTSPSFNRSVIDLFELQALATPDATAVLFETSQLSYRELNERANQIAHYLQQQDIGEDDLVPVCLERSIAQIVAIVGILKAGAAYVPVDPHYPPARIQHILREANHQLIITDSGSYASIQAVISSNVLMVSSPTTQYLLSTYPLTNPLRSSSLQRCSYIIYTSGSTGLPKGIQMPDSALYNLLTWQRVTVYYDAPYRVLQFASINFDVSFQEIFFALCFGGCICLLTEADRTDMLALCRHLQTYQITALFLPYVVLQSLATCVVESGLLLSHLKDVFTAGEQLKLDSDIEQFIGNARALLHNQYGPSEAHVVTAYTVQPTDYRDRPLPPIGQPVANTYLYIVSADGQRCAPGEPGELYIGGAQVARGYLHQATLTAARFIPDPFESHSGMVYKTGDICRELPDGNIEYIGRKDNQVKIRGYRIEPGEIESVLGQSDLVLQSVIVVQEDPSGHKHLIAYVVARQDTTTGDLHSFLAARLPDYMLPAAFILLPQLPLTNNGKVDKRALPPTDLSQLRQQPYVAASTDTEKILVQLWQMLLHLPQPGIHDDFFTAGGHSLLAMRLQSMVRKQLKVDLPVKAVFDHPTIAQLAAYLSDHQQAPAPSEIPIQERPDLLPLSFSQERLYFIDQLEGSVQYHIPLIWRIKGHIDVHALQSAIQQIINRHEALRTVIKQIDGHAYQHLLPQDQWQLLTIHTSESWSAQVSTLIHQPFDLSSDHPLRAHLLHLSEDTHVLVITLHHIAADGWSLNILVRELSLLYISILKGLPVKLDLPVIQYADYTLWQRQHLSEALIAQQQAYWKATLDQVAPLQLPTDMPRPAIQSKRGAVHRLHIDKSLAQQLQLLSQQQGATLFMTLLSVFKVLLYRYSGQTDVSVGIPVSGRIRQETEDLIGFFINSLAIRSSFQDQPTFRSLLQQVKSNTLNAYAHQDIPFEKVVEAVITDRDTARTPIFQVMFVLQNMPDSAIQQLGTAIVTREVPPVTTSKFDLTIQLEEYADGIQGSIEYCTDLFLPDTIQRMAQSFLQLLQTVVLNPNESVGQLRMLPSSAYEQLSSFNDTACAFPYDQTLTQLFRQQVESTPDAIAVVYGEQALSYKMLDERSNQVASTLLREGCGPGQPIGLLSYRGIEMIVSLLGILKSGNAYVPFHIDYPEGRIRMIMQDAGITKILYTSASLFAALGLPASAGICYDRITDIALEKPVPMGNTHSEDTAYIMYTSGTSGQPKGIAVTHRNVIKLVYEPGPISLKPGDKLLQWSNYAFDGSVYDIFSSLLRGATLYLTNDAAAADVQQLATLIATKGITHCFMTTALFNNFVDIVPEALSGLQQLLFGGEQVSVYHVEKALSIMGAGKLIHVYGPTETTVYATYHVIQDIDVTGTVPIGRPLANTSLLVLDANEQLVPIGVNGELYISGEGVSSGYVNNPTLTAEKFRTLPMREGRWYKTGDMVRWTTAGTLLYIQRKDEQVKIRGYRIETAEIEGALQRCTGISEALVTVHTGADGTRWLAGYILSASPIDMATIHAALKKTLPAYMIPSVLIPMDRWPLTANGKIDKKALPAPDTSWLSQAVYTAPRSSLEAQLVAIWESLLPVAPIGIYDNFFSMGGHSLLVTRVISAIRKQLETELHIQDLFTYPTISALASHIQGSQQSAILPPITIQQRTARIPLSFAQSRLWFLDRMQGSVNYHIPELLMLKGAVNGNAIAAALTAIVQRHEVLRTVFQTDEEGSYQIVLSADRWQLSYTAQTFADTQEVIAYAAQLTLQPFDLSTDYLLRAHLLQVNETAHALLLVVHHIAADGWSLPILLKEFIAGYKAYHTGQPPLLSTLAVQYADYTLWQHAYLRDQVLEKQLTYWRQQLADVAILQIPTDHPRPAIQSTEGHTIFYYLDQSLHDQIQQLSQQQGVTLFMTLLAAFKVLLHRYSQQDDICVGTPIANRTQAALEDMIGFFVNTLAIRSDLSGTPSFLELLANVKRTLLDAYLHQDAPFEMVVDAVVNDRDRSRTPLFQVMFVQQNLPALPDIDIQDITVSSIPVPILTSKFDIIVDSAVVADGIRLRVEYNCELYEEATISNMLTQYECLLRAIIAQPDQAIHKLSLLTPVAARQLLSSFNDTTKDLGAIVPVISLFEQQAILTPDAPAVTYDESTYSYRALNQKANQIAHYLLEHGAKEHTFIPVCMQRSIDLIAAILGILKTGAAYVPVDPGYPAARIQHILSDTDYSIAVTDERCQGLFPADGNRNLLVLPGYLSTYADNNPAVSMDPRRCTYLIYTSGSTGTPKGVQMPDSALFNLLLWQRDQAGYRDTYSVLQYASINFDVSFQEIFFTLSFGGRLYLIDEEARKDMAILMQYINDHHISSLFFPYVVLQSLAIYAVSNGMYPHHLKDIFTAGEQLKLGADIEQLLSASGTRLHNHYGPSEAHVVTSYTVQPADYQMRPLPPIGRPIYNTTIYILAADGSLCPPGVPGELYIGGVQVALGYLNLPALTAERFIDDPFRGGSMYKTGDICRWLTDGNIEYIGRKDNQIKIRGYRIETGEIEQVLQACEHVEQALVVVSGSDTAAKILVAYIVPSTGIFRKEEITSYVQQQLPAYMVPAVFISLDRIPLTNNGKVDKKALPAPDWQDMQEQYEGPRNAVETLLITAWQDILQTEGIGIRHNFFAAGGNSILAIRLVARLQRNLQVAINDLFLYPTIEALAKHVRYKEDYLQSKLDALSNDAINHTINPETLRIQLQQYQQRVARIPFDVSETIQYRKVLLLGATGFLGIHLLYELLHQFSCNVCVIVRGNDDEDAFKRLADRYHFYFKSSLADYEDRLMVLQGDIERPYFGLEKWQFLLQLDESDTIINSAANVKHYGSYASFEAANVTPIQTILDHYPAGSGKHIHHVSTTGIMGQRPQDQDDLLFTEEDIDKGQHVSNFYVRSKLAAEKLLATARDQGVPVNIYRVGHLAAHSQTGVFQENIGNNAFYNELKGFITLGVIPENIVQLEWSNVDQVATAMLQVFDKPGLLNRNYHVVNPHTLPVLQFADFLRSYGFPVEVVSMAQYIAALQAAAGTHTDLVNRMLLDADFFGEERAGLGQYTLSAASTDTVLQQLHFKWYELDETNVHRMLQHIEEVGFVRRRIS